LGWNRKSDTDDDTIVLDTAGRRQAGHNLGFSLIPVTLEELEAAQEREYWSIVGDPR
jgi:hypothetical protein